MCKCSRLSLYLLHPHSYWGHRPFFMYWSVVFQVDGSMMMLGTLGQGGVGRCHSMISTFCGIIFCKNCFWHQLSWWQIRPDLLRLQLCVLYLSSPLVLLWRHPSLKLRVGSCHLSTVCRQEHTPSPLSLVLAWILFTCSNFRVTFPHGSAQKSMSCWKYYFPGHQTITSTQNCHHQIPKCQAISYVFLIYTLLDKNQSFQTVCPGRSR